MKVVLKNSTLVFSSIQNRVLLTPIAEGYGVAATASSPYINTSTTTGWYKSYDLSDIKDKKVYLDGVVYAPSSNQGIFFYDKRITLDLTNQEQKDAFLAINVSYKGTDNIGTPGYLGNQNYNKIDQYFNIPDGAVGMVVFAPYSTKIPADVTKVYRNE